MLFDFQDRHSYHLRKHARQPISPVNGSVTRSTFFGLGSSLPCKWYRDCLVSCQTLSYPTLVFHQHPITLTTLLHLLSYLASLLVNVMSVLSFTCSGNIRPGSDICIAKFGAIASGSNPLASKVIQIWICRVDIHISTIGFLRAVDLPANAPEPLAFPAENTLAFMSSVGLWRLTWLLVSRFQRIPAPICSG